MCGDADLKRSQHYPVLFGRTVAETYMRECSQIKASGYMLRPDKPSSVVSSWGPKNNYIGTYV